MSNEDDFLRVLNRDLRRMVDETSPPVRARLDRIVQDVLQGRVRPRARVRRPAWPVGAMAATLAAVTLGLFLAVRHEPPAASPADDAALLLNVDNFELLEQMEFYLWLDRQPGILEGAANSAPSVPQRS
jgi:hypothetical protein